MARKEVRCPNCNTENAFDDEGGRVIDCISCCYDETIPAVTENIYNDDGEAIDSRIITPTETIKRGCTFEVDDKGGVVRVVSNG